jgi:hypothetical protein
MRATDKPAVQYRQTNRSAPTPRLSYRAATRGTELAASDQDDCHESVGVGRLDANHESPAPPARPVRTVRTASMLRNDCEQMERLITQLSYKYVKRPDARIMPTREINKLPGLRSVQCKFSRHLRLGGRH